MNSQRGISHIFSPSHVKYKNCDKSNNTNIYKFFITIQSVLLFFLNLYSIKETHLELNTNDTFTLGCFFIFVVNIFSQCVLSIILLGKSFIGFYIYTTSISFTITWLLYGYNIFENNSSNSTLLILLTIIFFIDFMKWFTVIFYITTCK